MEEQSDSLNDFLDPRPSPEPAVPGVSAMPAEEAPAFKMPVKITPFNLDEKPEPKSPPKADPSWEISKAPSKVEKVSDIDALIEIEDGRFYETEPVRVNAPWYHRSTGPMPIPERQPASRNSSLLRIEQLEFPVPFGKEQ